MLLRNGANPDLRDEDGKTPLDKVRQQQPKKFAACFITLTLFVVSLSARYTRRVSEMMKDTEKLLRCCKRRVNINFFSSFFYCRRVAELTHVYPRFSCAAEFMCVGAEALRNDSNRGDAPDEVSEPKGDPEMVPLYLRRLLPVFCATFQQTMVRAIRKSSLNLIRKMVHCVPAAQLSDLTKSLPTVAPQLVEVIASVLDGEDDDEATMLVALQMIKDLMSKNCDVFLEHFARLGVFTKVQSLGATAVSYDLSSIDERVADKAQSDEHISQPDAEQPAAAAADAGTPMACSTDDQIDIMPGRPYHWRDWSIVRGRDCLYLWSDAAALELSNGSNGWFRFILDGKLATMYSSGSPEGGTDSSENRGEFLEKLQRARNQVKAGAVSQSILSTASAARIVIGNWTLTCRKDGELTVQNIDGAQQTTVLREVRRVVVETI